MKIQSRDFGPVEIDEREIITFKSPIYGFEEYTRFAFLYDAQVSEHFVWLQSLEEPGLCFILVDPALVCDQYAPQLPAEIDALLGPEDCMCWLLVVIAEPFEDSTVNLRSPIVVNPIRKLAAQVILDGSLPIRRPLLCKKEGA